MFCASSQGSLGMLTTTETFRKRGVGSFLVQKVVDEAVKQGVVPYVHIENSISGVFQETRLGLAKPALPVVVFHLL